MEKKLEKILISKNGKTDEKNNGMLKLVNVEKISNFQQGIRKQKEKKIKIFNRFFHRLWKNKIQNQNTAFIVSSLLHKFIADAVDFIFKGAVLRHFVFDYIDGGENRCMVAAEYFCRVLEGNIGYAANDVDCDMPG